MENTHAGDFRNKDISYLGCLVCLFFCKASHFTENFNHYLFFSDDYKENKKKTLPDTLLTPTNLNQFSLDFFYQICGRLSYKSQYFYCIFHIAAVCCAGEGADGHMRCVFIAP